MQFVLYGDHNKDLTVTAIRFAGNKGVAEERWLSVWTLRQPRVCLTADSKELMTIHTHVSLVSASGQDSGCFAPTAPQRAVF